MDTRSTRGCPLKWSVAGNPFHAPEILTDWMTEKNRLQHTRNESTFIEQQKLFQGKEEKSHKSVKGERFPTFDETDP